MERTISVEEKIRRAQEIYARRQGGQERPSSTATLNLNDNHKDVKLLKKMVIQIIICVVIYGGISIIQNSDIIFSKEILEKANQILSYDTNFMELYETVKNHVLGWNEQFQNLIKPKEQQQQETQKTEETQNQVSEGIGGAEEQTTPQEEQTPEKQEKTPEEQEIETIKNTTSFIKPIEGVISSRYGQREPTTSTVPKNHTGTDIAANMGTKIKAATDGEVVLASEEGDYGKHLKVQIGEVSIIYAHCNNLYVKQGDKITQGQEIAEVGSTGNSTGPHLHFEVRYQEKTIDPEKLLQLN